MTKEEIFIKLISLAWEDKDYKESLLENPKKTLEKIGIKVDDHLNLEVYLDSPNNVHLVIPQKPEIEADADALKLAYSLVFNMHGSLRHIPFPPGPSPTPTPTPTP